MKKSAVMLSALIAAAALITSCGNGGSGEKENEKMNYPVLDSSNVKLLGRTYLSGDTLYLAFFGNRGRVHLYWKQAGASA